MGRDKWRAGSMVDVVDPSLVESGYPESEVLNCIEIGLLCVQENPADRPDSSAVVLMLSSPTSTPDHRRAPSRPAFVFRSGFTESDRPARSSVRSPDGVPSINDKQSSTTTVLENEVSISEILPIEVADTGGGTVAYSVAQARLGLYVVFLLILDIKAYIWHVEFLFVISFFLFLCKNNFL
jgi:hypothetical protein